MVWRDRLDVISLLVTRDTLPIGTATLTTGCFTTYIGLFVMVGIFFSVVALE